MATAVGNNEYDFDYKLMFFRGGIYGHEMARTIATNKTGKTLRI